MNIDIELYDIDIMSTALFYGKAFPVFEGLSVIILYSVLIIGMKSAFNSKLFSGATAESDNLSIGGIFSLTGLNVGKVSVIALAGAVVCMAILMFVLTDNMNLIYLLNAKF